MHSKLQKDFTEGNIVKLLIGFCVPFLISNLLQALYGMVDMLVVGNYCSTPVLTGVTSACQITHLVAMAVSGLTVGGTVLVAQYFAAHKMSDVSQTIGTLFSLLFICALALTALGLIFGRSALKLMNLSGEALEAGLNYLYVCLAGTVCIFGYNAISAVQRGMGDSKRPLYFVGVACAVNVGLDFLMVGAMSMGAKGAALATVIAQGTSLILAAVYLKRKGFAFDFALKSFRIAGEKVKLFLKLGVPSSMQSIITNISFLLMISLANLISDAAGASVGVVGRVNSFAILPVVAMSSSVSAIAAQNIAAEKFERASQVTRVGIWISLMFGLASFCLCQFFAEPIMRVFKSDDAEVLIMGAKYMRAISFDYLCVSFLFCMNSLVIASGHATFTMFNSALASIVLRMPLAWLLSRTALGIAGIGFAAPAASLVAITLCAVFLLRGKWRFNATGIRRERNMKV